jgi:parallel beta-helix repeat protein
MRGLRAAVIAVGVTIPLAAASTPSLAYGGATPTADAPTATVPGTTPVGRLIRVPEELATPRAAIDAAQPGDVILLAAGTYDGGLLVSKDKHDITIRGADRTAVVFDGKGFSLNAIEIDADRVTLENLSAHDFDGNGFYWEKVAGFTGRYLTVWNVSLYGIYATESRGGLFEHSLVSGAADAAFYVGECQPCDTTVRNVEGRLSAIGYSGTNTGAGLQLIDSTWDRNGTGVLPNSFDGQALPPPESESLINGNTIRDSGTVPVPANTPLAGFIGLGIGVAGGNGNRISNNTITGSARYGIALFSTLQRSGAVYTPSANQIEGNTVSGSGRADLAVAATAASGGDPNCFAGNTIGSSLPTGIEKVQRCGAAVGVDGDPSVAADLAIPVPDALDRLAALGPRPDWRTMPVPEAQPSSPEPLPAGLQSSPPAGGNLLLVVGGLVAAIAVVAISLDLRRRGKERGGPGGSASYR